ncbi:unnamed protein product [Prorocentrum cordatum]|uniref:Uncharacterized protein n=1 Tax=Prorocentrum cordatum TaxID=2364126 RepID=A0ABN9WU35_9DINO|nr:unnamed protein product [Polarella glacialis]
MSSVAASAHTRAAIVCRVCVALAALLLLSVLVASLQSGGARHLHRGSAVGVPIGARGYVSAHSLEGGWGQSGLIWAPVGSTPRRRPATVGSPSAVEERSRPRTSRRTLRRDWRASAASTTSQG